MAAVLEPGGMLIFDVNTTSKLEEFYGTNHYGDDFGDFAYVWRNRYNATTHTCEFHLTFYVLGHAGWQRRTEIHQERWFSHAEIRAASADAGLQFAEVVEAYSEAPVRPSTRRETWVLRATGEGAPAR